MAFPGDGVPGRVGQDARRPEHLGGVEQRLAHPHEDHARQTPVGLGADQPDLLEDLPGQQIAEKAHPPGGAEVTGQRAAHLARDADHVLGVEEGDAHRLDPPAERRLEEVLHEAVVGAAAFHDVRARAARRGPAPRRARRGGPAPSDGGPPASRRRGRARGRRACAPRAQRAASGASARNRSASSICRRFTSSRACCGGTPSAGPRPRAASTAPAPCGRGRRWPGSCARTPRRAGSRSGAARRCSSSSGGHLTVEERQQRIDGVLAVEHV